MIEAISRRILGERIAVPPEIGDEALPPGVTLRRGAIVPKIGGLLGRMRGAAAAVALRRTIVVHPDADLTPRLLAHELTHIRQWREDPLFPLRYALATIRNGYRDNPYEVEARAVATSIAAPQSGKDTT